MTECDVALITDARFTGGTSQAFRTDLMALRKAGLRVGISFFHTARFFHGDHPDNPDLLALRDLDDVVIDPSRARATFLHNPQVFGARSLADAETPLTLPDSERLFMITHHPPIAGDRALFYDPISSQRAILQRHQGRARRVEWVPISGLVRAQLRAFQPLLAVAPVDWVNTFDTDAWRPEREKLRGDTLVIGRHGRAHENKWPDTAADIAASLPAGPQQKISVLGADPAFFERRGVDTAAWEMLPFGSIAPHTYLDRLDIFSYFHSARWREAFGRTIAEAMMMGLRCVLDPHLKPTFGPHALYCAPAEVPALIDRIRAEPGAHRAAASVAGDWCRDAFNADKLGDRYAELMVADPSRTGEGPRELQPGVLMKKWIGFHRRARAQA